MAPLLISHILNKAANNELFPAPVRPITPIFSEEVVSNETPFKDIGPSCLKIKIHKIFQGTLNFNSLPIF